MRPSPSAPSKIPTTAFWAAWAPAVAPVFEPLGFGDWKPTVATVLGLVAKEEVVNVFGILYNTDTDERDTATLLEEGSEEEVEQGRQPHRSGL